jgi:hypothetical protein
VGIDERFAGLSVPTSASSCRGGTWVWGDGNSRCVFGGKHQQQIVETKDCASAAKATKDQGGSKAKKEDNQTGQRHITVVLFLRVSPPRELNRRRVMAPGLRFPLCSAIQAHLLGFLSYSSVTK